MTKQAITIQNLGKRYILGHKKAMSISDRFRNVLFKSSSRSTEEFWALEDINFTVEKGEAIGIIGKNGAGKSTLLKILSRITEPTVGRFEINGRVSSLLEVGTGFHPELTGRENIFLNGTILGMKRFEIKSKFNEIVDFSGVEKFLDTPVKHYSSGMYVRLAFSVAAHLEPEILIIDEVLAVGDAEFQKKCLGKMDDATKEGRTVLFVSHNMNAVQRLCSKGILLGDGKLIYNDDIGNVVDLYFQKVIGVPQNSIAEITDRKGIGHFKFAAYKLLDSKEREIEVASSGDLLSIRIYFEVIEPLTNCRISIAVSNKDKTLFVLSTENTINENIILSDQGYIDFQIARLPLTNGEYSCTLFCESGEGIQDWVSSAFIFSVKRGNYFGIGKDVPNGWEGSVVLVDHKINFG